ncbi:MAG: gliding motility-associated C-terminal domain-containing protein, partial [Bacteroidota bacterium]
NGCSANTQLRLLVDQTPRIFVPNVFAPYDSQNNNDRFTIYAKDGLVNQVVSLEIYNRWGETVYQNKNFSPNDPSSGWDGFFDNQRMKPAVFVYRASVEMLDGRTIQLSGDFALVE